jgi:hypothetical protein
MDATDPLSTSSTTSSPPAPISPLKDSIVEEIVAKFQERSQVGINKYGTTLDRGDLKTTDWVNHIQEELMDAILYTQRLRRDLSFFELDNDLRDMDDRMAPGSESTKVALPLNMLIKMLRVTMILSPMVECTEENCSNTETLDWALGGLIDRKWKDNSICLSQGGDRFVHLLVEKVRSELVKEMT